MGNLGNDLAAFGLDFTGKRCIVKYSYIGSYIGEFASNVAGLGSNSYDIACSNRQVWIATDKENTPLMAFNSSGSLVESVGNSTITAAMGLTIDDHGYLWASNPEDGKIYQIDLSITGIEGSDPSISERSVHVDHNPAQSSVTISAIGFRNGTIGIVDLSGKRVLSSAFDEAFTWDCGDLPSGTYFIIVEDDSGSSIASLTRIQ